MNPSKHAKLQSVLRNGIIVVIIEQGNRNSARIYYNFESRGYQTRYMQEGFFYLVGFNNGFPTWIHGVTKDVRRKTMTTFWTEKKYTWKVTNQNLFNKFIA